MIPPVIIGLTGAARSGKTTIAQHLQDKYAFHVLSFADPLKDMVKKLDPQIGLEEAVQYAEYDAPTAYPVHLSDYLDSEGDFLEETPEDWVKSEFPEYRRLLQVLGTECIRGLDQDFWVNVMNDRIQDIFLDDNQARIVIPDMRFPNEADVLRRWQAKTELVNVLRPGLRRTGQHVSEQHEGRMGETTIFVNDGNIGELLDSVDGYMKGFLGVITSEDFYETYSPQVIRAARREHKQTMLFDTDDLEQEIWCALLPYRNRLHDQGEGFVFTAALNAARRYAERERIDNMYFRGSFIYTPDMVRTELETGAWVGEITGDWDLRLDIRHALESLTEREQQLLFSKYMMGLAPAPGGEKTALYRAIDKMTHYLNGRSGMSAVDLDEAAEAA